MSSSQKRIHLLGIHLLQRHNNAITHTHEWQVLRSRHRAELTSISSVLMNVADWLRQKKEIVALGKSQKRQIQVLRLQHTIELDAINLN